MHPDDDDDLTLLYLKLSHLTEADKLLKEFLSTVSHTIVNFFRGSPAHSAIHCVLHHKLGQSRTLPPSFPWQGRCLTCPPASLMSCSVAGVAISTACFISGRSGGKAILISGQAMARSNKSMSPLMYAWRDKVYVGAAYGLAGILSTLLQAMQCLTPSELP